MLVYLPDDLRALDHVGLPARAVRKSLFTLRLWRPVGLRCRLCRRSTPSPQRPAHQCGDQLIGSCQLDDWMSSRWPVELTPSTQRLRITHLTFGVDGDLAYCKWWCLSATRNTGWLRRRWRTMRHWSAVVAEVASPSFSINTWNARVYYCHRVSPLKLSAFWQPVAAQLSCWTFTGRALFVRQQVFTMSCRQYWRYLFLLMCGAHRRWH